MAKHLHIYQARDSPILDEILALSKKIFQQGERLMSKVEELEAELITANQVTNEIAADVADLLNRLAAGGLTVAEADSIKAKIQELNARLMGVASQHTPV